MGDALTDTKLNDKDILKILQFRPTANLKEYAAAIEANKNHWGTIFDILKIENGPDLSEVTDALTHTKLNDKDILKILQFRPNANLKEYAAAIEANKNHWGTIFDILKIENGPDLS